ncbi:ATP-binding protein [Uliginosibacterium sp. 31-16]|uniref:hybrid sensor histidine kinase/response regulator n=1 Tax=Uliginosibacterium sp. 31-16 TaxID=3068315 RepID=UPI00273EF24F|nr:ATP-binding protein [Uliginosibacterium sp. 31-16]MDP5237982.1 ATP-binding protein [Uliginosibacterium sp. 31-16]
MSQNIPPRNSASIDPDAIQRVVKVRRDYNTWVANESIEDYALRYTPKSFRKLSEWQVANTAFGAAAFLVLEAVGATLLVNYGFTNAALAILATGLIIFLCGTPISLYAARYGLDMDLLTRGAGFGYIGSTITSLIYASFTFIFFALEAAVMAYALELAFDIPPAWGYLLCALAVIPLVTHGVTMISRLQRLTQPVWLILLALPFIFVLAKNPGVLGELSQYAGTRGEGGGFNMHLFGAALTVGIALITQMGEQVDYLRFMPARTESNRKSWLAAVLVGGPGWVLMGVAKMLGGCLLAYLAIRNSVPIDRAVDPNQMYLVGFEAVFSHPGWAVAATALFVIISQLKINVTNAYAGSLAWSNFFARLTHSHPGRVVWMVFNTVIALMLMELDVFQALGQVLGLYSNIAIAWLVAVVADLVINKPLGLSPPGIEFKRAHLYDINPVGVGAMLIASTLSIMAYLGAFGANAQAFASFIALATALMASPLIAWATGGKYYLARKPDICGGGAPPQTPPDLPLTGEEQTKPSLIEHPPLSRGGLGRGLNARTCVICERAYEGDDMAHCPAYQGHICSLCCSLDARCHDLCKPDARLSAQWSAGMRHLLPRPMWPYIDSGLGHYLLLMGAVVAGLAALLGVLYYQQAQTLADPVLLPALRSGFIKVFSVLLLASGIIAWWLVLTHKSRQVAQEESNRQTHLLMREIASHQQTDEALQEAKRIADAANQAKSRYITTISHELRTPLNSILGYAQILDGDPTIPSHRQQAIRVIRRSGDHLLSLIEGTLDIARIEGGKLSLDTRAIDFRALLEQLVQMFSLQAEHKGLAFDYQCASEPPAVVRADEKRLRQILINLLGNAVKFTREGGVKFRLRHSRDMATFEIEDSGPGITPEELERIFEPFSRGSSAQSTSGTGLGLTIARMLTDLMGGELTVKSTPGSGTLFTVRLFLPQVHAAQAAQELPRRHYTGYAGERRRILIVDNEATDRELLASVLAPLGFELDQAASGIECLEVLPRFQPHLIFMDLAMPGIDGWETIRRIRAGKLSEAKIAILSANAFDKGLENDAGIPTEDFILKPFKVAELLEWLGHKLALEWLETAREAAPDGLMQTMPREAAPALPARELLEQLAHQLNLGYVRGVHAVLDRIATDATGQRYAEPLRKMLMDFELDTMTTLIKRDLDAATCH